MIQNFSKIRFKENRLIYDNEGWKEVLKPVAEGAAKLFTAASELVGIGSSAVKETVDFMKLGFSEGKEFLKKVLEKAKDKIVGKPVELSEFDEFKKKGGLFIPPDEVVANFGGAPDDPKALGGYCDHASKIASLMVLQQRFSQFYKPAIDNFAKIENRLNIIEKIKSKTEDEIFDVRQKIGNIDGFLQQDKLEKSDPRRIELEAQLTELKSHLHILEESISKVVKWEIPCLAEGRFQITPEKDGTLVDLDALYRFLETYTATYAMKMKLYEDEIEKHEYYMAKTYEKLSDSDKDVAEDLSKDIMKKLHETMDREAKWTYDRPAKDVKPLAHLQVKSSGSPSRKNVNNFDAILNINL